MNRELAGFRIWTAIGWLLLAGVVAASLVPVGQPVGISGADKLQHALAYGVLMHWWGMLQPERRPFWLLVLPLMGAALELVQNLSPTRFMEWRDMLANLAGVSLAWVLLRTRAGRLLGWIDAQVFDRGNPGAS